MSDEVNADSIPVSSSSSSAAHSLEEDVARDLVIMLPHRNRIILGMVSRWWQGVVSPLSPRHMTTLLVLNTQGSIHTRPLQPRRSLHIAPPAWTRLADETVSQLKIDLDERCTQNLAPEMAVMHTRFETRTPLHTLTVYGNWHRMSQTLCHLSPGTYSSLRTLVLWRRYAEDLQEVFGSPWLDTRAPLQIVHAVPTLTTLKMRRVLPPGGQIPIMFPNLACLHAADCSAYWTAEGATALLALPKLRDLSVTAGTDVDTRVLAVIPQLTALTRLRLMGPNTAATFAAATALSRLLSLSLRRALPGVGCTMCADVVEMDPFCQGALELISVNNPRMLHLELDTHPLLLIPDTLTDLQSVMVLHTTRVPPLPTIREVVVRRMRTASSSWPLWPRPPNITALQTPYDELPLAVACEQLEELTWRPHSQEVFSDQNQVVLLACVSMASTWPALKMVAILPRRINGHWMLESEVDLCRLPLKRHCLHSAQLLAALATRPACAIERVCVFQRSSHDFGAIAALCSMLSLTSVTLVKMRVTRTQLRRLVDLPRMRIVELVGVSKVTLKEVGRVRAELLAAGRTDLSVLWREMACVLKFEADEDEMDCAQSYGLM